MGRALLPLRRYRIARIQAWLKDSSYFVCISLSDPESHKNEWNFFRPEPHSYGDNFLRIPFEIVLKALFRAACSWINYPNHRCKLPLKKQRYKKLPGLPRKPLRATPGRSYYRLVLRKERIHSQSAIKASDRLFCPTDLASHFPLFSQPHVSKWSRNDQKFTSPSSSSPHRPWQWLLIILLGLLFYLLFFFSLALRSIFLLSCRQAVTPSCSHRCRWRILRRTRIERGNFKLRPRGDWKENAGFLPCWELLSLIGIIFLHAVHLQANRQSIRTERIAVEGDNFDKSVVTRTIRVAKNRLRKCFRFFFSELYEIRTCRPNFA